MSAHDSASAGVFLVGIYEGVIPLVAKVFDWHPFLAFPLRLPNPWWWIVSVAVIVAAVVALDAIDKNKKKKRKPHSSPAPLDRGDMRKRRFSRHLSSLENRLFRMSP